MIDEILIQRLVDGELSNEEIRHILRDADQVDQTKSVEQRSSAWKQLAVAFAENQMVQRAFSDFDSGKSSADEAESKSADDTNITLIRQRHGKTALSAAQRKSGLRTMWTFAVAASLLIGVSFLYHHLNATYPTDQTSSVASNDLADRSVETANPLLSFNRSTLLKLTPDHQLQSNQLPTSFSNKVDQQVPLFDAKRFDRRQLDGLRDNDPAARRAWVNEVMPAFGVTDQLVADYEKAGLIVDQDIEFLSGRLDDGRAYMIPFRTVRFSAGQ